MYDPKLKKITVRQAATFPREIFEYADEAEILDLSFGHLVELPEDLGRFSKLRVAFFSHNDFEEIPAVLATCPSLELVGFKSCSITRVEDAVLPAGIRGIILTDNRLSELPRSIGSYGKLQKLMLAGNGLRALPRELLSCRELALIRMPLNQLEASPDWLFELPQLAWYSDSSNAFNRCAGIETGELAAIRWEDIVLGEKLGESAKNVVYRARVNGEERAVKLFGGGITADGAPDDDLRAALRAGSHPNLISGIGSLAGAPDGRQGMVMPLVSDEFSSLGSPPDLRSLVRDRYPQRESLSPSFISQVLSDVAKGICHLHERGILHGDIYAHNILSNLEGRSLLGDFGAASLYEPMTVGGILREKLDVRGFGCLLEDLLALADASVSLECGKLHGLGRACLDRNPAARPSFADICAELDEGIAI